MKQMKWLDFLNNIFAGDAESLEFLRSALGEGIEEWLISSLLKGAGHFILAEQFSVGGPLQERWQVVSQVVH